MAEDALLILVWTALATLFGVYALWKFLKPRNANQQRIATSQSSEDVKKARLKYFAGNEEVGSSSAELVADAASINPSMKHEDALEEETSKEERDAAKSVDTGSFEPSVQYTKFIEGPSKMNGTSQVENSSFDPETGAPVSRPLKTLEELFSWRQGFDFFNVATVPLIEQNRAVEKRPRTLVCHDMKGGYIEDRSVQAVGKIIIIRDFKGAFL